MYTADKNGFAYRDSNNVVTSLSFDEGTERIVSCIIDNFKHNIGPNHVVNSEEVTRLSILLYENLQMVSINIQYESLVTLLKALAKGTWYYETDSVFYMAKLCYRISKELILRYKMSDAVYAMVVFSKEWLFNLFLYDRKYYRCIVSAFYQEMEIAPYVAQFGFYDARSIYDSGNAVINDKAIDVDHIVIADVYANIGVQMITEGESSQYKSYYEYVLELSRDFWEITNSQYRNKIKKLLFTYSKLYKKALLNANIPPNTDGLTNSWLGMCFVIADIDAKFNKQKSIAKKKGFNTWNNVIDRRSMLLSSKILLGICSAVTLLIIVALIHDKSIGWAIVFLLAYFFGGVWVLCNDDSSRYKIYRQNMIDYELAQIAIAAKMGTWYEPLYLNGINSNYYYPNYFRKYYIL